MPIEPAAAAIAVQNTRRRPPVLVWITSALLLLSAALTGLLAADYLGGVIDPLTGVRGATTWTVTYGSVMAVLSVAYAVVAICVFLGVTWARTAGIVLGTLSVLASLVSLVTGHGALGLVLPIVVLVLLTRRTLADWCYPQ
jgi:hypothetical protein